MRRKNCVCSNIQLHENGCGHTPFGHISCRRIIFCDGCTIHVCHECFDVVLNLPGVYATVVEIDMVDRFGIPMRAGSARSFGLLLAGLNAAEFDKI